MSIIKKLPSSISSVISASEVVTSPSGVIKELVENSIDANSTRIIIEITKGGKEKISVTDNGNGIRKEEVLLAFEKHATSKIIKEEDLSSIATLGFRGEALFSIALVSKVVITTKTKEEDTGVRAKFFGGENKDLKEVGFNKGTRIEVKDLFFNTPARKKHLLPEKKENNKCIDIVSKLALTHPQISFELICEGKVVLKTAGDNSLKNVISEVLGRDFITKMIEVDYIDEPLKVRGYTLSPNYLDKQNEECILILNGRYIKSDSIAKSIKGVYKEEYGSFYKSIGYILYITLDYGMVDVNIHPAKTSVSILNQSLVNMLICEGIRKAIRNNLSIEVKKEEKIFNEPVIIQENIQYLKNENKEDFKGRKETPFVEESLFIGKKEEEYIIDSSFSLGSINKVEDRESISHSQSEFKRYETDEGIEYRVNRDIFDRLMNMKFIGMVFSAYALFEGQGELYAIDTHAAHERVLYDKLINDYKNENVKVQNLLTGVIIEVSVVLKDICLSNLKYLSGIGFEVEDFSGSKIIIRSIPTFLREENIKDIFIEILTGLKEIGRGLDYKSRSEALVKIACHSAVRGRDIIRYEDLIKLLGDLRVSTNPFSCPHSRPTISKIEKSYFLKMFKRI